MRTAARLAVIGGATLGLLGPAGVAGAAYAPRLVVQATGSQTKITLSQAVTDDPTAKITIYVPLGYTIDLSQPPRTGIGTSSGRINATDLAPPSGLNIDFGGGIQSVAVAEAPPSAALCSPGAHQAIWVVSPSAAGVSLEPIPIIVDRITSGPEAAFASAKLQVCLRPPDLPPGTPGRSPQGARFLNATFTILGAFTVVGQSAARWTALFTPYRPGFGSVNAADTVESQSIPRASGGVSLHGQLVRRGTGWFARLTGSVADAGAAARVQLLAGSSVLASITTAPSGGFTKTVPIKRTTVFRATATVPESDVTSQGCAPMLAACSSVTAAGFTAESAKVTVKVKPVKKKRRR